MWPITCVQGETAGSRRTYNFARRSTGCLESVEKAVAVENSRRHDGSSRGIQAFSVGSPIAFTSVRYRPMRPKTVLMLLTNAYDPDPRVRQEALALLAMGCRVRILAWDRDLHSPASQNMEGVEVERVFLRSKHGRGATQIFFYSWLYLKMLWLGMWRSFDAVHCHDLDTLPIGFILGKLKRKPIVYDAHESFPDMLEGSVPRAVQRGLVRLEDFLIRRIDLLITVGEKLRRRFVEKGVPQSVVVGNWKRTDDFSRSEEQNLALRKRLGIPEDALLVVCITQLLKDRKLEELLDGGEPMPKRLRHHWRKGSSAGAGGTSGDSRIHGFFLSALFPGHRLRTIPVLAM